MTKRIFIVILTSCISFGIKSCLPKGGGFTETCSYDSEMSKEYGVFISYYDMLSPFEYRDSIFYVKLAFSEVFAETAYTHRLEIVPRYDSAGMPFFRQSLVAVIDTSISEVEYFKGENYAAEYSESMYKLCFRHLAFENTRFVTRFHYREPVLTPPYYDGCGGIPDTLKVEVRAYTTYKILCGTPYSRTSTQTPFQGR